MNKIASKLFRDDDKFKAMVEQLTRQQFARRRSAYASESIFDLEDLEQELWCAMLESDCHDAIELIDYAEAYAEKVADRGRHKNRKAYGRVETPISDLPDNQRFAMENLFYSGGFFETD